MLNKLIKEFQKLYGAEGELRTYFAPGRVNLIGEHTDPKSTPTPAPRSSATLPAPAAARPPFSSAPATSAWCWTRSNPREVYQWDRK